ncbi:MAG TPA: ABC transporter ATP-binding protein [Bryobacteraceae bacterium]|nr:ABC transporter ATP-binding protein [Bryobacteraceae bacterium]
MIAFINICKSFGSTPAVDNVSLDVAAGELAAILGPSGCGKTTLLRMAGGYESPDAGVLKIAGRDMTRVPPESRNVGMVFQSYALFPHMTVFENVEFGLRMRRMGKHESGERVRGMLQLAGLEGLEKRKPAELSGGQQQRVAVARALVIEPAALLLDEPLANLDRNIRLRMREELKALQQRLRITTILVTHDQEEALAMADRIAIMNAGRVEQAGRPLDFFLKPATPFVANFLGLQE